MTDTDIQTLIAGRLEDMAAQVERLCKQGDFDTAIFLREEGLQLAEACDNGDTFMYITDFRLI